MKVLHLSFSDISGGAARAAYRLHKGLQQLNIDSNMLVQLKESTDASVSGATSFPGIFFAKLLRFMDRLPVTLRLKRIEPMFHVQWIPDFVSAKIKELDPDIVHLHWICGGFVRIETLPKFQKPVIWTLHDMWAFTGGCHCAGDCKKYQKSCGDCPQLNSIRKNDLSRKVWQRKFKSWQNKKLNIITPSKWLNNCASKSIILKNKNIITIPNGIDISCYKPTDIAAVRTELNLPLDKKLILFGAMSATSDPKKGFHYLTASLKKLNKYIPGEKPELITFGSPENNNPISGLRARSLGYINSDTLLSKLYSACDVFVAPSTEDNLPNTVMEALACGTPCVAFNIGGMPDMIEHQKNGYLAKPFDTIDLAKGILWVIENRERSASLSLEARRKVENEFELIKVSTQYADLYRQVKVGF